MPPSVEDRLQDIREAIVEINELLAGVSLEQFSAEKTRRILGDARPKGNDDQR